MRWVAVLPGDSIETQKCDALADEHQYEWHAGMLTAVPSAATATVPNAATATVPNAATATVPNAATATVPSAAAATADLGVEIERAGRHDRLAAHDDPLRAVSATCIKMRYIFIEWV